MTAIQPLSCCPGVDPSRGCHQVRRWRSWEQQEGVHQRWASRGQFLPRGPLSTTLQFADFPPDDYTPIITRRKDLDLTDLGGSIAALARDTLDFAESNPSCTLMLHLGGVLHRHPPARCLRRSLGTVPSSVRGWLPALPDRVGFGFRPERTPLRFESALHALADGFLLQGRIRWEENNLNAWTHADLFAETIAAFALGVINPEQLAHRSRNL